MLSYRVKRRKVSFERTNKRVVKYINRALETYRDDYWEPELELGLPVCTADYPEMDIREKIPMPTADEQGYYPAHDVSQMEAGYLDKLNRVQLKVHQMDCAINIGLVTYFRNLKLQIAERNIAKIQEDI